MTQQSGYSSMDWRIAVCGDDSIAHFFGKIALSDRGLQSACGEFREVISSDLNAQQRHPLCSECNRVIRE